MSEQSESKNENGEETEAADGEVPASGEEAKPQDPLSQATAEAQKFKEQWIRTAADFDNFRKRSRKEIDDARKNGREELLKEFLPVFDNLDRAMQSAQRSNDVKAVADGLGMVLKQFESTLGRVGMKKVPTKGAHFDPAVHEAIQQIESDEPPGTIVAEVQPGYLNGERLVRAAMVVVAKPRENTASATSAEANEEAKDVGEDEAKSSKGGEG